MTNKLLTILFSICFFSHLTFCRVCNSTNIEEMITSFPELNCTQIEGEVRIYDTNLTTLSFLSNITSISKSLVIWNNMQLISLEGLASLTFIGGDCYITGNSILPSLHGFESLEKVGETFFGDLAISGNLALTSVDGLSSLVRLGSPTGGGSLLISGNPQLTSISGISSLTYIRDTLSISGNDGMTSLGIPSIEYISRKIYIGSNDALTSVDGLTSITNFGGGFGDIQITSNDALINVDGLSSITSARDITIERNSVLSNLNGFSSLTLIYRNIKIMGNGALDQIEALKNLERYVSWSDAYPTGLTDISDSIKSCSKELYDHFKSQFNYSLNCDEVLCPNPNSWGENCELCNCVPGRGTCDKGVFGTGFCTCDLKYSGDRCQLCKDQYFGPDCIPCECDEYPESCDDGILGTGICDTRLIEDPSGETENICSIYSCDESGDLVVDEIVLDRNFFIIGSITAGTINMQDHTLKVQDLSIDTELIIGTGNLEIEGKLTLSSTSRTVFTVKRKDIIQVQQCVNFGGTLVLDESPGTIFEYHCRTGEYASIELSECNPDPEYSLTTLTLECEQSSLSSILSMKIAFLISLLF